MAAPLNPATVQNTGGWRCQTSDAERRLETDQPGRVGEAFNLIEGLGNQASCLTCMGLLDVATDLDDPR